MTIPKIIKPAFHVTGEKGWINDPNGLIFYKGKYHAFYQHYPFDTKWGPMHWGHVVSDDLTHWEYLPIALKPCDEFDSFGCFSGSAIEQDGKLYLMYTGVVENQGGETFRQNQCLAVSEDGITFKKLGIVIGEDILPSDYEPWNFRDPKVWKHDDWFWCAVGAKRRDGTGRIVLFKSKDLFNWSFVGDLFNKDSGGTIIECPDLNQEQGYLLYSEQFQPKSEGHQNVHTSYWAVGEMDYQNGNYKATAIGTMDYGFDLYAPQTFTGAPIVIGWLNMWDRNVPSAKYGFAGMLTVPRKVCVKDGRLYQTPVVATKDAIKKIVDKSLSDQVVKGVITITATELKQFNLKLRNNGENYTELSLIDGKWVFNRSRSGEQIVGVETDEDSLAGIRRMPWSNNHVTTLTIVMDEFSVEIFEDGKVLSSTIYPPEDANGLILNVKAQSCTYQKENV
ncbi:MAG: glycoside hydrolase family 32 protein [Clostridia bacterium]|nr:glycoside hydrolase family 32 protein [Clostridia bacterium]